MSSIGLNVKRSLQRGHLNWGHDGKYAERRTKRFQQLGTNRHCIDVYRRAYHGNRNRGRFQRERYGMDYFIGGRGSGIPIY